MNKYLSFLLVLWVLFLMAQTAPSNTRLIQPTNTFGSFNKSYIKHLKSSPGEIFLTVFSSGGGSYLGTPITDWDPRFISRIGQDGIPKWTAKFLGETFNNYEFNTNNSFATTDANDNLIVSVATDGAQSTVVDASGNIENIMNDNPNNIQRVFFKLDKDGNKMWVKKISNVGAASVITDNNNDVYFLGAGTTNTLIDGNVLGKTFVVKVNGSTGNVVYAKSFNHSSFQFIPVFDSQNNMYVFTEPSDSPSQVFNYDNVTVPSNSSGLNSLMLKMDGSGNVIWGKNFYNNSNVTSYSWMNDAVFDGTDLVVMGNVYKDLASDPNFLGLDGANLPAVYNSATMGGFIAKINLTGNVIWQKAIPSSQSISTGYYTNIQLDENKNFYGYFLLKDKVSVDGVAYQFDTTTGNKVISKFDTNGNLKYFNPVDNGVENIGGTSYKQRYIDISGNDQYNLCGTTTNSNFLSYPITNTSSAKFYVATFGNITSKYLTPEHNYLVLNSLEISNNPNNANSFSFNLINNVNWTATSDQNWLTLTYTKLSQKGGLANIISDNGDAKIVLNAETNTSGATRTANVLISGDQGVLSKTIIVTQTTVLGTNDAKTFVTTLYPNPTSDILNIKSEQKISRIEVYDISGKLLKSVEGKDKNVSVSILNKGMYLVKLYTENGVVNSKFIKN